MEYQKESANEVENLETKLQSVENEIQRLTASIAERELQMGRKVIWNVDDEATRLSGLQNWKFILALQVQDRNRKLAQKSVTVR